MSADNYVAVKRVGPKWAVWEVLGGYEDSDWQPHGGSVRWFDNELDAHHYAHEYCGLNAVEYGVRLVPDD